MASETLVVLLSDHGEMGGSHGLRNKQVPFEESLHVPLILRWPGRLAAGAVCDHLFSGVDIGPTTMGLCGVPVPAAVQGLDQSRALQGVDAAVAGQDAAGAGPGATVAGRDAAGAAPGAAGSGLGAAPLRDA